MQRLSPGRVKMAALIFVAIVVALVLSFSATTPKSDAQVGYGPQSIPDQVIEPIGSQPSSHTGLALGVAVAVVILGGAAFLGWRNHRQSEHPYP